VEAVKNGTEEQIGKNKKIAAGITILICTLFAIYFGMAEYFMNHFYFGSEINRINVSGKTIEDAKKLVTSELKSYTLNLKERKGTSEQIKADDIGLKYNLDEELKKFKDNQNSFKWISGLFTAKYSKMTAELSFNEKLLRKRIDKLSCFDSSNITEPKNPGFRYVNNNYVIVKEVNGNKVNKDVLYSHIVDSILKRKSEINLESAGCYIEPQYNSKSKEIMKVRDVLNKYVSTKITYTFGEYKEILDGSIINKWLKIDRNLSITIDDGKLKEYVVSLSNAYNTIGKARRFTTSSGNAISIGGGDYGRSIDIAKETQYLIKAIKEGQTVTKKPAYIQTAFSMNGNDIGNTYVEIDLTKQHLWYYKNGSLIVQGDVVTGNVNSNHATPRGIYRLKYKLRNTILRGPGYAAPVTFWMPFNGGIGIHDAGWRSVFGGNIYKTDGSHGCINCPYNVAKSVFNNIETGTPVICY
jgi:hypothetical protein